MNDDSAFLAYALLFRFGIIAAGSFAIYLGFLLLRIAPGDRDVNGRAGSTAEASIPGARFKLQNVTAGSLFALFGALLVVAMVLQGNPEKIHQTQSVVAGTVEVTKLRGNSQDSVLAAIRSGQEAEKGGDSIEAEKYYHAALIKVAPAMNALAWMFVHNNRVQDALTYAKAAVQIDFNSAAYLDTLAEAESRIGDQKSAFEAIKRAAELDPSYKNRIENFRSESRK